MIHIYTCRSTQSRYWIYSSIFSKSFSKVSPSPYSDNSSPLYLHPLHCPRWHWWAFCQSCALPYHFILFYFPFFSSAAFISRDFKVNKPLLLPDTLSLFLSPKCLHGCLFPVFNGMFSESYVYLYLQMKRGFFWDQSCQGKVHSLCLKQH